MYKAQRNYENAQRMLFDGAGQYDMSGKDERLVNSVLQQWERKRKKLNL